MKSFATVQRKQSWTWTTIHVCNWTKQISAVRWKERNRIVGTRNNVSKQLIMNTRLNKYKEHFRQNLLSRTSVQESFMNWINENTTSSRQYNAVHDRNWKMLLDNKNPYCITSLKEKTTRPQFSLEQVCKFSQAWNKSTWACKRDHNSPLL